MRAVIPASALFLLTALGCLRHAAGSGFAPEADGLNYARLADSIRRLGRFTWQTPEAPIERLSRTRAALAPVAECEPLHPAFLAACDALGGPAAVIAVGSLAVAGAMALWFSCARIWCGAGSWAPWAMWLLLLAPNPLYEAVRTGHREPLLALLLAGLAWSLTRGLASGHAGPCLGAGLCWGLAVLTKSAWLAMAPLLAWTGLVRSGLPGWRRGVVLASAACFLTVAPWTLRNRTALGLWIPVSSAGGVSFMTPNLDHTTPWDDPQDRWGLRIPSGLRERWAGLDEAAFDRAVYRHKMGRLAGEPLLALRAAALNLAALVYPVHQSGAHALSPALLAAYAGIVLLVWRRRGRLPGVSSPWRAPFLMLAAWAGVHAVYTGQPCYRAPLEPVLLAAGAWGWETWVREGARGRRLALVAAVLLAAVAARVLWTPAHRGAWTRAARHALLPAPPAPSMMRP